MSNYEVQTILSPTYDPHNVVDDVFLVPLHETFMDVHLLQ